MPSATPEPSELVPRLRQQLILAQVRIMELEDVRDELTPKLAELDALLRQAQSLADAKLDEAAHLQRVLADAQARGEELDRLHRAAGEKLAGLAAQLAQREQQRLALEEARR